MTRSKNYPKSKRQRVRIKDMLRDFLGEEVDLDELKNQGDIHIHMNESGGNTDIEALAEKIAKNVNGGKKKEKEANNEENFEPQTEGDFDAEFDVEGSFGDGELGN